MASSYPEKNHSAGAEGIGESASDIAFLWQEALDKYRESSGQDATVLPRFHSTGEIKSYTDQQTNYFNQFRSPPSREKINKLRGLVMRNVDYIEQGAKQLQSVASPAFPPTTAIVTVFLFTLRACKDVSADYDTVVGFFDEVNSFFERIGLVEKKLPVNQTYQTILMRVFASFLSICGISTQYIKTKRFKKWMKALVDGEDPELKAAKDTMNTNIGRLESATAFMTMANTQDIRKDTYVIRAGVYDIKGDSRALRADTEDIKLTSQRIEINIQAGFKQMAANFDKMLSESQKAAKKGPHKARDPSERKHIAFNQVQQTFSNGTEPGLQSHDIEYSIVEGTSRWFFNEQAYKSWIEGQNPFLWISGPSGVGKSCLAYSAMEEVKKFMSAEPRSSVASFYFMKDDDKLECIENALCSVVMQISSKDTTYCEQLAAELAKDEFEIDVDDFEEVWKKCILEKFSHKSDAHLYLILDGIDEADMDQRADFLQLLQSMKAAKANIHVIFTSRPSLKDELQPLEAEVVEVTTEKISGDIHELIEARLRSLPRLRKFRLPVKKKIAANLKGKADGLLYVDHMLRRYESIGREGAVLKDMATALPESLQSLYSLMVDECRRRRTPEELDTLRHLFYWLAFSTRQLTLREVSGLIALTAEEGSFSLEEELNGKSSRIFELTLRPAGSDEEHELETIDNVVPDENYQALDDTDDDGSATLRFRERALREYIREMDVDIAGLDTSSSTAHLTILETITTVLCGLEEKEAGGKTVALSLRDYAAYFWPDHLEQVDIDTATDDDVVRVTRCLASILGNRGNAAKWIEDSETDDYPDLLSGSNPEDFQQLVGKWAARAVELTNAEDVLHHRTFEWARHVVSFPQQTLLELARGHVMNWIRAENKEEAVKCAEFAVSAVALTDADISEAARDAIAHAENGEDEDESVLKQLSAEDIRGLAALVDGLEADVAALRAIAFVLEECEYLEAASQALEEALAVSDSESTRLPVRVQLGRIYKDSEKYSEGYEITQHSLDKNTQGDSQDIPETVLQLTRDALVISAMCQDKLGKTDDAIQLFEKAMLICPNVQMSGTDLSYYVQIFVRKDAWGNLVTTLEKWNIFDLMSWLVWTYDNDEDAHSIFQQAAKLTGKTDFMVQTYEQIIRYLNKTKSSAPTVVKLADAYRTVLGDAGRAKTLLYEALDTEPPADGEYQTGEDPADILFDARDILHDILFEEFREANNAEKKTAILEEVKRIPERRMARGTILNSTHSTLTAAIQAQMIRKIRPPAEFQQFAEKTFRGCIDALRDTVGWNDQDTLVLLGQLLACVGGLERDAQISISAMFSHVDPEVSHGFEAGGDTEAVDGEKDAGNKDGEGGDGENEDGEDEDSEEDEDGEDEDGEDEDGEDEDGEDEDGEDEDGEDEDSEEDEEESRTLHGEDLAPDWEVEVFCDGECGSTRYSSWIHGSLYTCITCANCTLCEECYQKRQAYNCDEPCVYWKTYCGKNHHYIKGPIEGWRGIKAGVMTIGDTREAFGDWLQGLSEERWPRAWEAFWTRDDLATSIL